jgi:5-methyltetrahydrofolate--homocysteine methyltransferase
MNLGGSAPIVTDGALGTQLQERGLDNGTCADTWNLLQPQVVEEVGRRYVDAGSRVILTNSFRSNRIALAGYALADRVVELNRLAVTIARRAAGDRARVFGSIGPTGKLLISGEISTQEAEDAFAEQARALAEAGADAIAIETMTDLEEAKAAIFAAKETALPVVACMVFGSGRNRDRTMMGITPEQVADELSEAGADVIGANCGVGIAAFIPVCRRLRAHTDRPIWIKPNAGLPEMLDGRVTYRTTPREFAAYVPALMDAGATYIGGCCGTTPDFIREVAAVVSGT